MKSSNENSLNIQVNVVFEHLLESTKRITVEQGGTRSGKTYNILLWIILEYLTKNSGKTVSIIRKTFPSLRASVMRDFEEIFTKVGFMDVADHNKSSHEIRFNNNLIEFVSLDQAQKIRGRKRDLLFCNEANELTLEDWRQLTWRTKEKIIIDYNPSSEYHWIYEQVVPRDDCEFFQTNYEDNPFLEASLVEEIERLKESDPWYWKVYGLGERAANPNQVYRFGVMDLPKDMESIELMGYGLDWGFVNDPTAVVAIYRKKSQTKEPDTLIFDELLYEKGLDHDAIGKRLEALGVDKRKPLTCDSEDQRGINVLTARFRFNARKSIKGQNSVVKQIPDIQSYKLFWTSRSINGIREGQEYMWETKSDGTAINTIRKPLDGNDHLMDAMRYGVIGLIDRKSGTYNVR